MDCHRPMSKLHVASVEHGAKRGTLRAVRYGGAVPVGDVVCSEATIWVRCLSYPVSRMVSLVNRSNFCEKRHHSWTRCEARLQHE